MDISKIKALTFDTGGTILDWHTGFRDSLAALGDKYGVEADWHALANDMRRRSLGRMLNLGKDAPPAYNFDGAHAAALDDVLKENGLDAVTPEERRAVWWDKVHSLKCWPDFPAVLPKLREKYICTSFTILSLRIVIDTARQNDISWDSVISCEAFGKYKVLPEAYQTAAKLLQLEPHEICMVACHNFDLDAAKGQGYNTAFVRRPDEWGPPGPPDPTANPIHDIIVDGFPEMARELGVDVSLGD
ncbi:MAG: HAD family hydrolase [Alphaproteobacteria bacterium]